MRNLFIFILLLSILSVSGQDIKNLKVEQPYIRSLFVWSGNVIVEKENKEANKFYVCDTTTKKIIPLTINGYSEIYNLAESEFQQFAIAKKHDSVYLISKAKQSSSWKEEAIFPEFNADVEGSLVATGNFFIFVTAEKIYYKTEFSQWQSVKIDKIIKRNALLYPHDFPPKHSLLTASSLFLGYDNGEWSGALIEIPFTNEKKLSFVEGKRIVFGNIKAISQAKNGDIWCATGQAHLGIAESGVLKYADSKLEKVLWSNSDLSLSSKSDLSAFCLNDADEPFFVASELGVFKIVNGVLQHLIKANLYLSYPYKGYSTGSSPEAMYSDNKGNIFIASHSLGVFFYTKNADGYDFSQLNFE